MKLDTCNKRNCWIIETSGLELRISKFMEMFIEKDQNLSQCSTNDYYYQGKMKYQLVTEEY